MGASYSHRSSGLHPEVGARRCRCSCSSSTQLLSAGGLIKFACRPLVKTRSQRPWRRAWLQRLILSLPNFFHPPPALPRPPPGARGLRATALVIAGVRLHELVFFLARHVSPGSLNQSGVRSRPLRHCSPVSCRWFSKGAQPPPT